MNTKRDKKIAEALEIEWHETEGRYSSTKAKGHWRCLTCDTIWYGWDGIDLPTCKCNPDFSTDSGMCLILRKGPEREWWGDFSMEKIEDYGDLVPRGDIFNLLQDPNDLADELKSFFRGEKP